MKYGLYIFFLILISELNLQAQLQPQLFSEKKLIEESLSESRQHPIKDSLNSIHLKNYDLPTSDSLIKVFTAEINTDSVRKFISGLQNLKTRYAYAPNTSQVASWIQKTYKDMGYTDVVIDSFLYNNTWQKNVIATLPGKNPKEVVVVGGHYDNITYTTPNVFAPGADDNASGTSMALEIARVLAQKKYTPECTIKFLAFGAEEQGLNGSNDYAEKCLLAGMDIKLMINGDMISYSSSPLSSSIVDVYYYTGSESWLSLSKAMVSKYTKIIPATGGLNSGSSDSYSFWKRGFPVTYFMEHEFSPYYHTNGDTIENYNMPYCAEVIKAACAVLINASGMTGQVKNLSLYNTGDGKSIKAVWSKSNSLNFQNYKVYVGKGIRNYSLFYSSADTTFIIDGLTEGTTAYIAVSVLNSLGYESPLTENSIAVNSLPVAPASVVASTGKSQITVTWKRLNSELDFLGYNLYRADSLSGIYKKQNPLPTSDSIYIDKLAVAGSYYYYLVRAVDKGGLESINSNIVSARLFTLDQGIGLFISAKDGDGSVLNPAIAQIADFYKSSLNGFKYKYQDFIGTQAATISDLGAYSTVIWCNNSSSDNSAFISSRDVIAKYLLIGGKLIVATYFPTTAFATAGGFGKTFKAGDFIYDYLKVSSSKYALSTYFSGAVSQSAGYSSLVIDTKKTPETNLHQIAGVEIINPTAQAQTIYAYDSKSETNSLKGGSVGIEYIGSNYKIVLLSFPLYYMDSDQLTSFFKYVLSSKFSEPLSTKETSSLNEIPQLYNLKQNYPNPFNPSTVIEYQIHKTGAVSLKVYDMLGREVATLINNEQKAGSYSVNFSAAGLSGGVYFYRLKSGNFNQIRKMVFVK